MQMLLVTALFAAYTVLSVSKHLRVRTTAYDLGIFEQAVRGYAEWGAPIVPLKGPGFHLLGDHFHPILALLGPVYRLFPGPITLLVAQAALFALSALPVTRLATGRFGIRGGLAVGAAYGLSWGVQQAVAFDFHEICFAVPLLAFSLECLVRRRWGAAVAWAAPLVLVKEDLPLTVAAIGGYLILRGQRRLGAATLAGGVVVWLLVVGVLVPSFNRGGAYPYTSGFGLFAGIPVKLGTVAMILLPTALLAARSPLMLIALPTLAWRFWADNPFYWGTHFHYSAVLMPIAFVAMLESHRWWIPRVSLAVALLFTVTQPLNDLADPATWRARSDPAATAIRQALRQIPDGATVAASNRLAPQLTARCEVYLYAPGGEPRPEWVAIDGGALPGPGYRQVHAGDGVLIFRFTGSAPEGRVVR